MRVHVRAAMAGEMLCAGHNARRLYPARHLRAEARNRCRIRAEAAAAYGGVAANALHVHHGRKVVIQPHFPHGLAYSFACQKGFLRVTALGNLPRGGRIYNAFGQPLHAPALLIRAYEGYMPRFGYGNISKLLAQRFQLGG